MYQISGEVLRYLRTAPATLMVAPDAPKFTILYANPAYHEVTLTTPTDIIGHGFLEAFPKSPEDPEGDNVYVLRNSLIECVRTRLRIELPGKRYDVPIRGTNRFETKYWQASNNPVFDEQGELVYIAHVTVEITGAYDLARKERIAREVTEAKRRDMHSLLMEAPAAIAILHGENLVYEFENAAHSRIFSQRQLLGKSFTEAFPEKGNSFINTLKNVFEKGETYEEKELLLKMPGLEEELAEDIYWNFIYKPRYNAANEIDGIIIFGYNVTDQVLSRKDVEGSEKRLQTILETMAEGIGIVNREGVIVYTNPMSGRLFGLKKEEITGRHYFDTRWQNLKVDDTPLPAPEHPMTLAMDTGEPVYDHEIGVQRPDGERFYISINAAPLKDENGTVTGAIGTFMDVTQRRKAAQMKDEFVSTVSHELKTPLTSIKAYLQILSRSLTEHADQDNLRFLGRLGAQVGRLESLIKDFLDVTRIESDKLQLKAAFFDMDAVMADIVSDLQVVAPAHQLIITHTEPLKVFSDESRVMQVLTNLITNAVKYSPGGDKVLIALRREKDELICSVQDFGIGIAESQKALVFDRFHQAGTNRGSGMSLGLGLYISKEIVDKAGGRIWLESITAAGSTFYFSLPLLK